MKKIFTILSLSMVLLNTAFAGDKFSNLTEEYLVNKASLNVRTTIAKDPQTSSNVLEVLKNDSNEQVRNFAKQNLK
ncbi:hypothetical protein KKG81_05440 [bacterium]|jgi:hypothetical protein|nr:hypothetical protein [bacterium]